MPYCKMCNESHYQMRNEDLICRLCHWFLEHFSLNGNYLKEYW